MWKYSSFREKLAMIYVCAYPCQSTITVFHWQPAMVGSGTRFQVEGDQPRAWKAGYRGWLQVAQGNWGELTIDVWFSFSIAQELRRSCSILLLDVDLLWEDAWVKSSRILRTTPQFLCRKAHGQAKSHATTVSVAYAMKVSLFVRQYS